MKIGILTFHRAYNFGAVLQAYALQTFLLKQGQHVEIVDYRQPFIDEIYSPFSLRRFNRLFASFHLKGLIKYLLKIGARKLRKNCFESFYVKRFKLGEVYYTDCISDEYDLYVIGSDQLWNSQLTNGIDSIYWGNFNRGINKITYGMSTSLKNLQEIDKDVVEDFIKNFVGLSFREKKVSDYFKKIYNKANTTVLDPTFLLRKNEWNELLIPTIDSKYIVTYQARIYKSDPNILQKKAKELALYNNYKIIELHKGNYTPEEFLSYIKNAECVVTSSFHACAFGIIFNRPLQVFVFEDGHDDRYVDLLNSLDLDVFLVKPNEKLSIKYVDYKVVEEEVSTLRMDSIKFLNSYLR
jgi:hypothetical protein